MIYFQALKATAAAGATGYDGGLRSTAENPKRLLSILVQVQEEPKDDCMLQVWYEQEKIAEIPTKLLDSCGELAVAQWSYNRLNEIEIGMDIPIGALVRVAVKAVGFAQTIAGAYRYEITT
ncbi:hypothetical protein ES707_08065 [subsurface metagenome]